MKNYILKHENAIIITLQLSIVILIMPFVCNVITLWMNILRG